MATSDGYPTTIVVAFVCFYSFVFVLSTMANSLVLSVCYKALKIQASSNTLKWFIANLAIADLTFTLLSILDLISFLWNWVGGQVTCKLQGFLIEACYTASITTLVFISFERLKAVVKPFNAMISAPESVHRKLAASWVLSLVTASPLFYAYQTQIDDRGALFCTNITFGDLGRQIYYSIHAVCFFVVPLIYMIYAQSTIFRSLRSSVFPMQNAFTTAGSKRHLKAAKPLVALTVAFATCWSPFIFVRTLMYFHLTDGGYIWRASQLLIFLNTALDPILYGIYGENLKPFLKRFFTCTNSQKSEPVGSFTEGRMTRRIRNDNSTISSQLNTVANLHLSEV